MAARLRNFDLMWDAYPNPGGTAQEAKTTIGGGVDVAWITNTCVVRVSRSFNESGNEIPRSSSDEIVTTRGADGKNYALRVREFKKYLRRKYGQPDVGHEYPGGVGGDIPDSFVGRQGVIAFDVDGWSDATGHVDLWNGSSCRHAAYFNRASAVYLWGVPNSDEPVLAGSVGKGGRNSRADVEIVQRLLTERGLDPGPIDGVIGPKTIGAIREFQARFLERPDGRVDVDGRTWRELNALG